jgi:glycosyltransferase involved in cell wall biosynthesis
MVGTDEVTRERVLGTEEVTRERVLGRAAHRRLSAVAPHILGAERAAEAVGDGPGPLLAELARAAKRESRDDLLWLLIVGLTGAFPTADRMRGVRRALKLACEADAFTAFVAACGEVAAHSENLAKEIDVVSGGVVADVDFCATNTHNTGIQRVVRHTMARWDKTLSPTLVAWTRRGGAMRSISETERARVVSWGSPGTQSPSEADEAEQRLIVPFRSTVVVAEVPRYELCEPLAALAEFSGNTVSMIGYDAIPIVSADTVPAAETERFVRYLAVVKHAHRVVGISRAAADEFEGFADALVAQGLRGPTTVEVLLPVDAPDVTTAKTETDSGLPLVLVVGSQEPRKNHDAILFAAEMLRREGLRFRLRFIGGGSLWFTRGFDKRVSALRKRGQAIEVLRGVDDATMLESYHRARFTVFPSLHEGYGLPVAESLALGTPAITTVYGSTAEIAADGGCLLVDPRDDDSLVSAIRTLLVDDDVLARLHAEIAARPARTWDDYATELWQELVAAPARTAVEAHE